MPVSDSISSFIFTDPFIRHSTTDIHIHSHNHNRDFDKDTNTHAHRSRRVFKSTPPTPSTPTFDLPRYPQRGFQQATSSRSLSVHVDREPHSSLPPSLENHPFLRAYGQITTIPAIMGQVQTRGSVELQAAPSSGPDPTIFRQHPRFPNVQIATPPVQAPPMQATRTDETYSRLDYAPAPPARSGPIPRVKSKGALPTQTRPTNTTILPTNNSFGSRSKGLARKLSRKGPPAPIVTKKSMGPDPFEAGPFSPLPSIEMMEGLKTAQELGQEFGGRTAKAGIFPLRQVTPPTGQAGAGVLGSPLPEPVTPVPFPSSTSQTMPAAQAAVVGGGVHRRVSSMTRSPRLSIRSSPSRRAEREWRAKVAGLAHTYRAGGVAGEARGPVPPKRQLYAPPIGGDRERSSSPEDEALVTPVGSMPSAPATADLARNEQETPAKSFVSNRSFETLGHYAHLCPTRGADITGNPGRSLLNAPDPGPRQCSVPQSVVSSFYFDHRASRASTHLSPLNTLSPIPAQAPSSPSPDSPLPVHKAALPPFESFTRSPASVGPPPSPTPTPFASPMVYPVRHDLEELDSVPPLSLSKSGTSRSSYSDNRHSLPVRPLIIGPGTKSPLSPGPKTPIRQIRPVTMDVTPKSSCPPTPYSPTTNYILHSDQNQIDQHLFAGNGDFDLSLSWSDDQNRMGAYNPTSSRAEAGSVEKHPYARTPSMLIDSPPRKAPRQVMPLCPRREVVSPPCRHVPAFPSHPHSHAHIQQGRQHRGGGFKAEIVGAGHGRLSGKKVDLTPGMDTGMRPPKSGLPVSDLERWLASTSIGDTR